MHNKTTAKSSHGVEIEHLFEAATGSFFEGIALLGKDGNILSCNATAERFFLSCSKDWRSLSLVNILNRGAGKEILKKKDVQFLLSGNNSSDDKIGFETKIRTMAGQTCIIQGEVSSLSLGENTGGILLFRDITQMGTIREKLLQREEQLRTLINAMPDIVCFKDGEGRWLEANDADLRLFMLEGVDYRGKTDLELAPFSPFYADAFKACKESDEIAWREGKVSRGVEIIPLPDGKKTIFDIIKVPLFEKNGDRKGLVVLGRNIDERVQFEEKLIRQQKFLQRILDSLTGEILVINPDYTVALVNRSFKEKWMLTDFSPGIKCYQLTGCKKKHPDKEAFPCPLTEVLRTGTPFEFEYLHETAEGGKRYMEGEATPIFNDDGEIIQIVECFSDITDKRQIQKEYYQAQKMEVIGRLAGGVAHDFNNLLQVVLGTAELLSFKTSSDDEAYDWIQEILQAAKQASALTRQLLLFGRRHETELRIIDLNIIVSEMARLIRRIIGEDICLSLHLPTTPSMILADRGQIEQILMNLCVNARDAMPKGGDLAISIREISVNRETPGWIPNADPGQYYILEVTDTGLGIDKKDLSHIFEPFFSTKEAGKGTGLGLSTVFGIVKSHNGFIHVHSTPGIGSVFELFFPVSHDGEKIMEEAEPNDNAEFLEKLYGTVLLIEDAAATREIERKMLRKLGVKVLEANDGFSALSLIEKSREAIDLVISDLRMPGMNGIQTIKAIRRILPDVPALCASGDINAVSNSIDNVKKQFDGFLKKPFSEDELREKIVSFLQKTNRISKKRSE